MMVPVSLDSPSCEVTLLILYLVVYRDVTRQAKGLYRLKHVGALRNGLTYLSRYNSGWFCHTHRPASARASPGRHDAPPVASSSYCVPCHFLTPQHDQELPFDYLYPLARPLLPFSTSGLFGDLPKPPPPKVRQPPQVRRA
jgi:hypothetical protein